MKRFEEFPRNTSGFVWDTGHGNMYGDQEEIAESLGDRLVSWHLNDNPGNADSHLVPGEGTVDWEVVRQAMDTFRGPFIYELLGRDFDPLERMKSSMAWHRKFVQPETD